MSWPVKLQLLTFKTYSPLVERIWFSGSTAAGAWHHLHDHQVILESAIGDESRIINGYVGGCARWTNLG